MLYECCWFSGGATIVHYGDVIKGSIASQITSLTIVYSAVYSDADQRKHQSSASLAFVRGIHRGPVNSPHKWPVTRKMFPFDDVIMRCSGFVLILCNAFYRNQRSEVVSMRNVSVEYGIYFQHDDVIKWKHFPRYWPFGRRSHRSPVNSPHKGQWRGALMLLWSSPEQTVE